MNKIDLIDKSLLVPEEEDYRYSNSPFSHLKRLSAKQKGKRYELITDQVLKALGYDVRKPQSTDYDRIVDGFRCEIKGSTLSKNSINFSFLQIRPKQDYDKIIFSMFYPSEFVMMEMSKDVVLINIDAKIFKKQHGGNKGSSDTYLYYGNKDTLLKIGAKEIHGKFST